MLDFLIRTKILGSTLYEILFWLLIYGVIGWILESILRSIADKKFVNRGFLFGPFIPIYAFGGTGFVFLLNPINMLKPYRMHLSFLPAGKDIIEIDYKYYLMILAGMVIASVLEYVVSFTMEKLFHQRWWDYTPYKYNTKGRVCFSITICWGALSVAAVKFIHPLIGKMITDHVPPKVGIVIIFAAYALLLVDTIVSNIVASKKKKQQSEQREKEGV